MFGFRRNNNRHSTKAPMQLFPYRENVRYNVGRSDQKRIAKTLWGADDHEFEYESNLSRPSKISPSETGNVEWAIEQSFKTFVERQPEIPNDETIEFALSGMIMGLTFSMCRSVEIPCSNIKHFGLEFVEHAQDTILAEWPDWRLMILGDMMEGEAPILVYPTGVCIGEEAFEKSEQAKGIHGWQETIFNTQEERERPRTEQEAFVLSKTADAVKRIDEEGVILIASFDNEEGDYERYAHWFLFRKSYALFREITSDEHYHSWEYDVGSDGQKTELDDSGSHSLSVVSVAKDFGVPASNYELIFVPDHESNQIKFSFVKNDLD